MSQSGGDDFLIDLFREEVRANCQVLTEGLVVLEQGGASPKRLEEMMRAAHSIKGAARVVNLPSAVNISHSMEDCFVRAQKSELQLTSRIVDLLLACVDLLQGIAQAAGAGFVAWLADHGTEVSALVGRLKAGMDEGGQSPPAMPDAAARPTVDAAMPAPAEGGVEPAASTAKVSPGTPAAETLRSESAPAGAAAGPPTPDAGAAQEGVVRVTARNLTRLMGLAGESLVESRWLQPFAKSLLRLKQLHGQLAETIEGLGEAIDAEDVRERPTTLLADARQRLAACRELLADRIGEFDRRTRDADDLGARLYREVISSRMRPFREGVQGLPRLVRDLARQLGKNVQLEIQGETTEVNRDILEKLDAPLNHLVRNALDHGFETPAERQAAGKPEIGRLASRRPIAPASCRSASTDNGRGIDVEQVAPQDRRARARRRRHRRKS